jgi:5-methylcytosine-specific restriction endonuclease McrA
MSHGSDRRINSWLWTKVSREVRKRDMHRCQWRLEGCTEYAGTVDHIVPRSWGGAMFDRSNLCASCFHCNRKRQSLGPGEPGSPFDGARPEKVAFFSGTPKPRGGLAKILPRGRWSVIRADYSRKKATG